jgi:hypothetical protein
MAPPPVPQDGRMTSFQALPFPLNGGELMWIGSPGNAAEGNLYNVTTDVLAAFFSAFPALNTEIVTAGSTYNVQTTDTRILVDKTLGSPTSIIFPLSNTMQFQQPVLIKDIKGDAFTNNITISFSGGQKCDNQTTIPINNNYGWTWINPIPGGSGWYQS